MTLIHALRGHHMPPSLSRTNFPLPSSHRPVYILGLDGATTNVDMLTCVSRSLQSLSFWCF
jgi:hypothetical protein